MYVRVTWGSHHLPRVFWEHAYGGAGVGMDLRVGWQPKQQRAGVRLTLEAPVGSPALQQLLLLKPSCHGLTQTQRYKRQGPELAQTTEKGVSRTPSTTLYSFSLEASVPRSQTNRAGAESWPTLATGVAFCAQDFRTLCLQPIH